MAINNEQERQPLWKKLTPYAAATAAALSTYGLARKFRPSAVPELAALQQSAKDKAFRIATNNPVGRGTRSVLFGAKDVPSRPAAAIENLIKGNETVLHHDPGYSRVQGAVNINKGMLPDALDDKYIFSKLIAEGTGGGAGVPTAIPETHLLKDIVRRGGTLKEHFPKGYVIKPRTGSLSSEMGNILTETTPLNDPRILNALRNPSEHIIQEKIPIKQEYRVHTINNVPFASFNRYIPNKTIRGLVHKYLGGRGDASIPVTPAIKKKLEDFVRQSTKHVGMGTEGKNILGMSENVHQALDVAMLPSGEFKLIESNPTPGTLMNPIVARKLQAAITGRTPRDVSAGLGALTGVGGGLLANKLVAPKDDGGDN